VSEAARSPTSRTAVVIVNHNTIDALRRCLTSVLAQSPAHVLVVDTESTDGSPEVLRRDFPAVELLSVENRGYGAAANVALAHVLQPYVVLLNSDASLVPGALDELAGYLDANPLVAVAGPRIVDARGRPARTARRFPSPFEILLQESGLDTLRAIRRPSLDAPRSTDWVLGAALALQRSAVCQVGGFDDSYFMYNEEIDLCLRLRRAGWEVHYLPSAAVVHLGGASTSHRRAAMAAHYVSSTMLLYERHLPRSSLTELRLVLGLALAAKLVRDGLRLAISREAERRERLREAVAGWSGGLRMLADGPARRATRRRA
jgi:N-acetylglucosaminyl-diphospho-decaprenol L-rhamnosyltransferase